MESIMWVILGLIVGWLAGLIMKGSGYGLVGDVIVGIVGAASGFWVFNFSLPLEAQRNGLLGSIIVTGVGAIIFISLARVLTRRAVRA